MLADQYHPNVAMNDDGFVVVWASAANQDGAGQGVFRQRFDANGDAAGAEFQVNTYTTNYQRAPRVAMYSDGRFGRRLAEKPTSRTGASQGFFPERDDPAGSMGWQRGPGQHIHDRLPNRHRTSPSVRGPETSRSSGAAAPGTDRGTALRASRFRVAGSGRSPGSGIPGFDQHFGSRRASSGCQRSHLPWRVHRLLVTAVVSTTRWTRIPPESSRNG